MSDQNSRRKFTKEEIRNIVMEFARELGRTPTLKEVKASKGLTVKVFVKFFGSYSKALEDCDLEPSGPGHRVDMTKLFEEWAGVARKLGKLPTVAEFELHSKYSASAPIHRFGLWSKVPAGLLEYAEENNLTAGWEEVVEMVKKRHRGGIRRASTSTTVDALSLKPRIHPGRLVYGDCASECLLVFAPTNEMGVIAFFCSIARKLGFLILWIGGQFPDLRGDA